MVMEVDKVADEVADMEVDKVADMVVKELMKGLPMIFWRLEGWHGGA